MFVPFSLSGVQFLRGGLDSSDGLGNLLLGAVEPIRAPNSMDYPSMVFKNSLAQPVTVSRGSRRVIAGAIALNAEDVPAGPLEVSNS
jgi:hypothetical protein